MITNKSAGVIRVVRKFVTQAEYLNSFSDPIKLVDGIFGSVLQAVNCTVQCSRGQSTVYDEVPYVFSIDRTSPQLIWLGFDLVGYSILSQSITGDIGNSMGNGQGLFFGAAEAPPTQGDGDMWVSLWYTIWPDKGDF